MIRPLGQQGSAVISLRLPRHEIQLVNLAAGVSGLSRSAWLRGVAIPQARDRIAEVVGTSPDQSSTERVTK